MIAPAAAGCKRLLDGQQVFRKRTNATESLRTYALSLIDAGLGITADVGTLY
jgi:hypothetical protein